VDSSSFHRICQETEQQTVVLETISSGPEAPPSAGSQRYWPCPECRRLMNRQNFARVSGIIVDVCKGHGVWFNQGELRRIIGFIRDGGMSRARNRERQDLEDERARLRATARDAQLAAARPATWAHGGEARTSDVEILSAVRGLLDWIS
jgi:Zn-finger nucleic acid-binding protein